MIKELSQAIMPKLKLQNLFIKDMEKTLEEDLQEVTLQEKILHQKTLLGKTSETRQKYSTHKNFCVTLF